MSSPFVLSQVVHWRWDVAHAVSAVVRYTHGAAYRGRTHPEIARARHRRRWHIRHGRGRHAHRGAIRIKRRWCHATCVHGRWHHTSRRWETWIERRGWHRVGIVRGHWVADVGKLAWKMRRHIVRRSAHHLELQ